MCEPPSIQLDAMVIGRSMSFARSLDDFPSL